MDEPVRYKDFLIDPNSFDIYHPKTGNEVIWPSTSLNEAKKTVDMFWDGYITFKSMNPTVLKRLTE